MMRKCAAELGVLKAVGEYFDGVRQKSGEDEEAYLQRAEELADRAINSVRMLKTFLYQFDVRMEGGYEKWKETQSVFNRAIRDKQREHDGILTRPGYDHRNRDLEEIQREKSKLLFLSQVAKDMKDMKKVEAGGTVGVHGVDPTSWRAWTKRNFRSYQHALARMRDRDKEATENSRKDAAHFQALGPSLTKPAGTVRSASVRSASVRSADEVKVPAEGEFGPSV